MPSNIVASSDGRNKASLCSRCKAGHLELSPFPHPCLLLHMLLDFFKNTCSPVYFSERGQADSMAAGTK